LKRSTLKEQLFLSALESGRIVVREDGSATLDGKPIPTHGNGRGYRLARMLAGDKRYSIMYHCLVWLAFHGPIPEHLEVNHRDGNKLNNALANLELTTRGGNIGHAWQHGLRHSKFGWRIPREHAEEAGREWVRGTPGHVLAARYGYSTTGLVTAMNRAGFRHPNSRPRRYSPRA
jgi:hypothetical protein